MKREILLEALLGETRLAVVEDGRLCELYVERASGEDAGGSVYLGRVENVVPGMNAAFVDIGLSKNGFLSAADASPDGRGAAEARIEKLVRPGQDILVQAVKAQSGQKGHRLSCRVTLPGRLMALTPGVPCAAVSKKIAATDERERLQAIAKALIRDTGHGMIVRTAAAGVDAAVLEDEWRGLVAKWRAVEAKAQYGVAPLQLFSNDSLVERCARELLDEDVQAVWADGDGLFEALRAAVASTAPQWLDRLKRHRDETPLFDLFRVDAEVDKALRKYVWLKSGGSLVIEATEAMTVVDVNTGKFTGKRNLEDTLFKINCEAAEELVRQLRLRAVGGIIIVDFIDMERPEHGAALVELLQSLAKADKGRLKVVGMTGLGLVELTRKKQRRPLSEQLLHTCSACGGDGATPSHETTARRCLREIWRRRRLGASNPILVEACPPVAAWLKTLGAPEGGRVYVRAKALPPAQYEISPADEGRLPEGAKLLK